MERGIQVQQRGHQRRQTGRMMLLWTQSGTKAQLPKMDLYHIENVGMSKWIMLGKGFLAM